MTSSCLLTSFHSISQVKGVAQLIEFSLTDFSEFTES